MFLKYILLVIVGLSSGAIVAGGLFTFINKIGIVPRLAETTRTAAYIHWYETAIICGGAAGNVYSLFALKFPVGWVVLPFIGLFSGIFVGCLIGAIAEVLNSFPIFFRRIQLKQGVMALVISLAAGKFVGVLIQYFVK